MRTAIAVGMLLAACAMTGPATAKMTHQSMAAQVSAAKTAKDHNALAALYAKQANEARALAEKHDEMATAYKDVSVAREHCKALADNYRKNAQELDALADAERQLAKGGGK